MYSHWDRRVCYKIIVGKHNNFTIVGAPNTCNCDPAIPFNLSNKKVNKPNPGDYVYARFQLLGTKEIKQHEFSLVA